MRIKFDTSTFDRVTKDQAAKFVDILSAIGGTMGLLTGFSIISGVEILYFTAKNIFNYLRKFKTNLDWCTRKIFLKLTSIYFNVLCSLKCIYFKILLSLCCRNGLHSNILHSYTWNFFWNTLYHVWSAYSVLCQH